MREKKLKQVYLNEVLEDSQQGREFFNQRALSQARGMPGSQSVQKLVDFKERKFLITQQRNELLVNQISVSEQGMVLVEQRQKFQFTQEMMDEPQIRECHSEEAIFVFALLANN